jgi:hypothetical protein
MGSFLLDDSKGDEGGAYKESLGLVEAGLFGAPPNGEKLFFVCPAPFAVVMVSPAFEFGGVPLVIGLSALSNGESLLRGGIPMV